MEVWKDIKGFEGLYQISNLGNVKSLERFEFSKGIKRIRRSRFLKQQITKDGYKRVGLCKNSIVKLFIVHRIVAESFLKKDHFRNHVNHINGIKEDNRFDNLEWCTPNENTNHAISTGLRNFNGSKNGNSKLSEKDVLNIRNNLKGISTKNIAKLYDIDKSNVNYILQRKTWKHI